MIENFSNMCCELVVLVVLVDYKQLFSITHEHFYRSIFSVAVTRRVKVKSSSDIQARLGASKVNDEIVQYSIQIYGTYCRYRFKKSYVKTTFSEKLQRRYKKSP